MTNLFPVGGSVADVVTLNVVSGKLVMTNKRRVVKGKDGPTTDGKPAFPMKDGKPVIGPNVYRIPTKAELTAAGASPKLLGTPEFLIPLLVSLCTTGHQILIGHKAA